MRCRVAVEDATPVDEDNCYIGMRVGVGPQWGKPMEKWAGWAAKNNGGILGRYVGGS